MNFYGTQQPWEDLEKIYYEKKTEHRKERMFSET